jgi:hypothetical protein
VINLCSPGFRITDTNVASLTKRVEELDSSVQLENCTAILQLYDNTVYQAGGPGGVRHLPLPDRCGTYHIKGSLHVADKNAVKEMTTMLQLLVKALGQARKAFLSPLTQYWIKPCCEDPHHHTNYPSPTYLPALGASVFRLCDHIRDTLYTRRCSNFRVICTNRLLGIGPNLSDDAAKELSQLWGTDPIHPLPEAYDELANKIMSDILIEGIKYINPPKDHRLATAPKKPRTDLACSRQGWVEGCSAALPRRDTERSCKGNMSQHKLRGCGSASSRAHGVPGFRAHGSPPQGEGRLPKLDRFSSTINFYLGSSFLILSSSLFFLFTVYNVFLCPKQ